MVKGKATIWLRPEVERALAEYAVRRGVSPSTAADHLLERALTSDLPEGLEWLIIPQLEAVVRRTVAREIIDQVVPLLDLQTGTLVRRLGGGIASEARRTGAKDEP